MPQSTGLWALALGAMAVLCVVQGQETVEVSSAEVAQDALPKAEVEELKVEAFQAADDFEVGQFVELPFVFTETSPDAEVQEVVDDPDFVAEEEMKCCPEGYFCCGMELGCLPDAAAPDVMCPVRAEDSPIPCCDVEYDVEDFAEPA